MFNLFLGEKRPANEGLTLRAADWLRLAALGSPAADAIVGWLRRCVKEIEKMSREDAGINEKLKETRMEILHRYRERTVRWTEFSLAQLSFYNNLLLTLGVGFLAFAYQDAEKALENARFTFVGMDCYLTFYVLSLFFVGLSILLGLLVGWSRLYDFRLTRHINLTRQRELKQVGKKLKSGIPPKIRLKEVCNLMWKIAIDNGWRINMDFDRWKNQKEYRTEISNQFQSLRRISVLLGKCTWLGIELQMVTFGLAALFYVSAILAC